VIAPNKTLAAQLYHEFRGLFPPTAVRYFVSYYDYYQPEAYVPSSDTFIEKDASINDEIDKMRHAATVGAARAQRRADRRQRPRASTGLGSPEAYSKLLLFAHTGQKIERDAMLRRLVNMQYARKDYDFTAAASACVATSSRSILLRKRAGRCASSSSATRSRRSARSTRCAARC